MIIYIMGGMCLYLCINNFIERKQHNKLQKDLLNRLMSRDFPDYTAGSKLLEQDVNKPVMSGEPPEDYLSIG